VERDLLPAGRDRIAPAGAARSRYRAALAAAAVFIVDQTFKWLVVTRLAPGRPRWLVPGVLSLRHTHNPGAAFGTLAALTGWGRALLLCALPLAALGLTLWIARHLGERHHRIVLAVGLITGGAASNLLDRIGRGFVIDYVGFFARRATSPTYNLADLAIIAGIALLLWAALVARAAAARG
jgi:signal peptidase II